MSGARPTPPECVRLAAALRELRAATGLSLAALAAKSPYSKSSWERYLNGRAMPPRQAVEHLCTLAGAPPQRPVALWELAEAAWSGRAGRDTDRAEPSTATDTALPAAPRTGSRSRKPWIYGGTLAALSLLAAGTLIAVSRPGESVDTDRTSTAAASASDPGCHAASCTGKDPEDQDCSTRLEAPFSLGEQRFGDTTVKVRRSEVCKTVWARIDRGVVGDRVELVVPGTHVQRRDVEDEFDEKGSLSTPMAAASDAELGRVQACLVRRDERRCFAAAAG